MTPAPVAAPVGASPSGRPRVVIVGSGFGGLFAAQALRKAPVHVTLVAKTGQHLFQPLLYQAISRFSAVVDIKGAKFAGFFAWLLWPVVHLMYIVGFKSRVTAVLHWMVSFLGRGRAERVATQQQVYGRLALEQLGPGFVTCKTGGSRNVVRSTEDVTEHRSA